METRGRLQNTLLIRKIKGLKEQGKTTEEISKEVGMSRPMVRYYLSQVIKDTNSTSQRGSLTKCFFSQPIEVQREIAARIGYIIPEFKEYDVKKYYDIAAKTESESDLIKRVRKFLKGEIEPNEVEENFSQDEMKEMSKNKMFMEKTGEIFFGKQCNFTIDEIIQSLKNQGL